ncbi:MAG: TolC family protein [Sporomusaceae bacterium]|nr:TolC family protein [Sporomusaceae bacterium]
MKHYHHYCAGLLLSTFIFLTGMQLVQAAPEPATLTLSDSIALALDNSPAMKIAASNQEKAAWSVKEAKAHKGLSLGYNYSLARTNQAPSWYNNTESPTNKLPAWSTLSDGSTAYNHQLKLQLPLYTGGKIENTISLAKHGSEAVALGTTTAKQQLTLDVTTSYFSVLQARNLTDVAQEAVDDLDAHLTNAQKRFDAGTVSLSDVLQTQVRLSNARNNLIKAQNGTKLARYKLNTVVGLPLQNQAVLADKLNTQPSLPTVENSVAAALQNRSEMTQANLKIAMAKDKVKIAGSGKLPTVALVGTDTWADTSPSTSKDRNSWLIGMNVQFNVFDNGLTNAQIKQADHEVTQTQEQANQLTDKISLEVCQAYLSVQEATERITNNKVAVQQSQTDYQLAQQRYEAGITTNLDVMDAELAMIQAKTNYIQALYDGNSSMAQLDKAMGVNK